MTVQVERETKQAWKEAADRAGLSLQGFVRETVDAHLNGEAHPLFMVDVMNSQALGEEESLPRLQAAFAPSKPALRCGARHPLKPMLRCDLEAGHDTAHMFS